MILPSWIYFNFFRSCLLCSSLSVLLLSSCLILCLLVIGISCILILLRWIRYSSILLLLLMLQFLSWWTLFHHTSCHLLWCWSGSSFLFFDCACCLKCWEILPIINCFTNICSFLTKCSCMWPTTGKLFWK